MSAMIATRPNRVVTEPGQSLITCTPLFLKEETLQPLEMLGVEGGDWRWRAFNFLVDYVGGKILDYAIENISNLPPGEGGGVSEMYSPMGYEEIGLRRAYH